MHIQDLKRWHWILIAIPIGIALSYAWTSIEPSVPRHIGQETFERQLVATPIEDHPWLANLVVHPATEGVMVVTGEQLTLRPNEKVADYKPFAFNAITPYQPLPSPSRRNAPPPKVDPSETALTYLAKTAAKHEHVRYRFAWERQPSVVYAVWTGGAILLIGGVWPTLVSLLVGAGYGRSEVEDDDYDLDRFGKSNEAATAPALDVGLSAAHLAEVEAELQRNLEGFGGAGASDAAASSPPDVRTLGGGPVEPAPLAHDDPNDYKGEFYPVAKPHGKPKA
ncbi:MAG: hypothetical protein M3478_13645 [Planctomycetota bacterium]|nr:hypothetical protein [Planctomycetota bacterium]